MVLVVSLQPNKIFKLFSSKLYKIKARHFQDRSQIFLFQNLGSFTTPSCTPPCRPPLAHYDRFIFLAYSVLVTFFSLYSVLQLDVLDHIGKIEWKLRTAARATLTSYDLLVRSMALSTSLLLDPNRSQSSLTLLSPDTSSGRMLSVMIRYDV